MLTLHSAQIKRLRWLSKTAVWQVLRSVRWLFQTRHP